MGRHVRNNCTVTCNNSCTDDEDYTFVLFDSGETKRCNCVGQSRNRKEKWCNRFKFKLGRKVKNACCTACSNCNRNLNNASPTSMPSTMPSFAPTHSDTLTPTIDASSFSPTLSGSNTLTPTIDDADTSMVPSMILNSKPSDDPSTSQSSIPWKIPIPRPSFAPSGNPGSSLFPSLVLSMIPS